MDNEPKTFSLVPQTEDEMNDLAERGIDWIKAKLLDAEAHIPVVAQTKAVALEMSCAACWRVRRGRSSRPARSRGTR